MPPHADQISAGEAGKILGVSRVRVWQLVEEGKLRAEEINPRLKLLNRADVEKLRDERQKEADAPRTRDQGRPPKQPGAHPRGKGG